MPRKCATGSAPCLQQAIHDGMALIPGGQIELGSLEFYPEERPLRRSLVPTLWVDASPVTNAEFRQFVTATGYVTVAEQELDPADFPGVEPDRLRPGSLVFKPSSEPIALDDWRRRWSYLPGACWRSPLGPG
jgi:sulfatase modifying factor 1